MKKELSVKKKLCPVAGKCGGCQLLNMSYERQLAFKQAQVVKLFSRYCRVSPIVGMESPYRYRNKVSAAFGKTRSGKIISGIYQSSTHTIVKTDDCLLEDRLADEIILSVRQLAAEFKTSIYNEHTQSGFLRHVLVRRGFSTGETLLVLVTGSRIFPGKNAFIKELLSRRPEITSIVQNVNGGFGSMVLSKENITLYGDGCIEDILCGKRFRISAGSFYQINPVQTQRLYAKAIELAGLSGSETVIDAYCGIGTIGIIAADGAKSVIAAELNEGAIRDAKVNARLNGADNITFVSRDAGEFMSEIASHGENIDVVFTDPPRAGCSREFLESAVKLSAKKIVYISCCIETQARDVGFLTRHGYKLKACCPFDMFPNTKHIETVVWMSRQNL